MIIHASTSGRASVTCSLDQVWSVVMQPGGRGADCMTVGTPCFLGLAIDIRGLSTEYFMLHCVVSVTS